jgi:hypothetical protein
MKTKTSKKKHRKFIPPEALETWIEHTMPLTTDLSLLILKGHLLVEEQIDRLITRMCEAPKFLDEARLTFFQKFCLTLALVGKEPVDGDLWDKCET